MSRISVLRTQMQKQGLDTYLVTDVKSIYYLTGFLDIAGASLSLILPAEAEAVLITMPLSFEHALADAKNCYVKNINIGETMVKSLLDEINTKKPRRLGHEGLKLKTFLELSRNLPNVEFEASDLVANQRAIKDELEVSMIRKACELADIGVEAAIEALRPGVREYEVAAQAEYAMRIRGSKGFAFETLVASGPRTSLPHGVCSERVIREGDLVTVDLGAVVEGYCSDVTRTVVVGSSSPRDARLLNLVQTVHDRIIEEMRPGVKAADLDALARSLFGSDYR
ncbi:MAG: Xaa-Pro peptidase family protein, partial [Candidatus Bathyarchaeia archaeon]